MPGKSAAAAEQLATNSADLATNNLKADGGTYDDVVAAAQAPDKADVRPTPSRPWRRRKRGSHSGS